MAKTSGHLENVNMQGDKLFIRAEVANQDIKNQIWNEIKKIDPQYADLTADVVINPSLQAPAGGRWKPTGGEQTTVHSQAW